MHSARDQATKAFAWQAMLILLPVAVLAAFGVYSLRQDKLLAQHEAAERAQALAGDLLPKIWAGLTNQETGWLGPVSVRVSAKGALVSPVPWSPSSVPKPLDLQALNAEQQRLWVLAETQENQDPLSPVAVQAFREVAMEKVLDSAGDSLPMVMSSDLEAAVREAARRALPGEVILLAPACASFDQFRSFEHRGEVFKQIVGGLAPKE